MTAESYYRWCLKNGIETETKKHRITIYLDSLKGTARREAECRLPPTAVETAPGIWEYDRNKRARVQRNYPKYFNDFKNNEKYSGIIMSYRHLKTSPAMLFENETILGPDEDRNTFMYWYLVELNRCAEEKKLAVPYIKTEDGYIALFKSRRKIG